MLERGLDFLVKETMDLSKNLGKENNIEMFPEGPGIIYWVKRKSKTFHLEGKAVKNLKDALIEMKSIGHPFLEKELVQENLNEKDRIVSVRYFETDYFELAQVIVDHVLGRSFPLSENDLLYSILPDGIWWLEEKEDRFKIHFKTPAMKNNLFLGPLGDPVISKLRFKQLNEYLRTKHNCDIVDQHEDYVCFMKKEGLETDYAILKQALILGELPGTQLTTLLGESKNRSLILFFKEIMGIRKFWKVLKGSEPKENYLEGP